ncbi:NACHT domain-containing protein [Streptomyces albus subsp. chlorinus]|uniref:NACHT domain-containing protein n=1 Tax=Streptomyces albus TaxID=1888 RepID=UPI00156E3F4B|nr:NACHT domain-containing protein [Streptomyces albus]NSC23180.1 NACHT domain-containing protein [Streptomyces albus subsp. chlorinus]
MDAGVVGLRIASSVMGPLVRKLFVSEGPGAGLVERPVRVSSLVSFTGEKRTLGRKDLEKTARELVRRALRELGPHEAPSDGEAERAAARLTDTLHALGDIGLSDVEAVSLGHTDFARALHARATMADPHPDATPGEDALYHRVLETASLHILHFFTQRSPFVTRTLVEQSRKLADLVTLVDVLIDRIPSRSAQDAEFEQQYARYIANRHRTLTIYGIDLQQASEWPLDTAYLSLTATAERDSVQFQVPDGTSVTASVTADSLPVEQALAGRQRVLLRGIAGSGKTTLVQWLAVTTARQSELTGRLAYLIGRVPFVLPLRTLTRGDAALPVPAGFLAAVGCPLAGSQPPGWPERVLGAGRGVLLVDGIDEVPEEERARARDWLRELTSAFPGNLVLVTSRPSAVREDWLGRLDFAELTLSPMRPADVDLFIDRWHAAAEAGEEPAASLRTAVRAKADLARLATSPLMCGLLCALHRERHGFLPRGRKALYDAALSMLLERRDRERAMYARAGAIELDEESQIELLQKLAYWLIRNGRSEMTQQDAVELVERVLPSMPYVAGQGSAEEIFRFLLVRSGLLREPGHGAVDFVHRTFQDYLGAKAAVEERDFGVLVRHAHLDQWEDVVRMAVAHARPDERARILRGLVERGDEEPEFRGRLHLLAMACLEHATKLDPAVRHAVEERARELIPPRSVDEAKRLVPLGGVVLDLLSEVDGLEEDEAVAVAHTAAQMGTDAALVLLKRFCDHPSTGVLQQLAGHWDRFDADTYAREIIGNLPDRREVRVTASAPEHLAWLRRLPERSASRIRGAFTADEIVEAHGSGAKLVDLSLARNPELDRLDFVRAFPHLEKFDVRECPVTDLSPLKAVPLTTLYLWNVDTLRNLEGIEALTSLRWLALREGTPWPGVARIAHLAGLTTLLLPEDARSIKGITALRALETLNLYQVRHRLPEQDWEELGRLPRLEMLTCEPPHLVNLRVSGTRLTALRELYLPLGGADFGMRLPPAAFPALERLILSDPPPSLDLTPLGDLPVLRSLVLSRPQGPLDTTRLPPHLDVTVIPRPRGRRGTNPDANAG